MMPVIENVSYNTGVPEWILAGVLYNESNARPWLISDRGRGYGAASIHCGKGGYNWIHFLRKKRIGIDKCKDLLQVENNIIALAVILVHIKKFERKRGNKSWSKVLTTYNRGPRFDGVRKGYVARVTRFGKKITKRWKSGYFTW